MKQLLPEFSSITDIFACIWIPDLTDRMKKHWTKRLSEYSMQDLIAGYSPWITMSNGAAISVTYVYDPSNKSYKEKLYSFSVNI